VVEDLLQAFHAGEVQDDGGQQDGGVYAHVHQPLTRLSERCFAVIVEDPGIWNLQMSLVDASLF